MAHHHDPASQRARAVQQPIIPHIADLIRRYPGTLSLGQGVVHYAPPDEALRAIADFPHHPDDHKYKATHGIPQLLDALRAKLASDNGVAVGREHTLMVTAGSNMAFAHAVAAIADPGDEVILLTPYYFNHDMALTLANVRTVCVQTDDDFQPRVDWIESAITARTRAVVTISPNNPTGAVYPEDTLRAINGLCRDRGLYHIHDEAYEYFVFDGARHFSPASLPSSAPHTISLHSFSKTYGMASWRVGYLLAPAHLDESLRKIQDTVLICAPVISQYAATGALAAGRAHSERHLPQYDAVRREMRALVKTLGDKATVPQTQGALYFFLRLQTELDGLTLAEKLIADHGIAVIPGTTFGISDQCCVRVSYGALDPASARDGTSRLVRGLQSLL